MERLLRRRKSNALIVWETDLQAYTDLESRFPCISTKATVAY